MSLNLLSVRARHNHTSTGPSWQDFVLSLSPWSFLRFKEASTSIVPADSSGNARPGAWQGSPVVGGASVVPGDANGKSFASATGPKGALLPMPAGVSSYTMMFARNGADAGWGTTHVLSRFPSNGDYITYGGGYLRYNGQNLNYTDSSLLVDATPHIYVVRRTSTEARIDTDVGGDFVARTGAVLPSGAQAGVGFNYFPGGNEGESGQYGEAAIWDRRLTDDEVTSIMLAYKGTPLNPSTPKARFWRLYVTASQDGGSYMNLTNMSLRATPGGYNQCSLSGGSANQSSVYQSYVALPAFKNIRGFWHSGSQAAPWWAYYDFGAGNERAVAEIAITGGNVVGRQPKDFQIQTSPDGMAWTTVATYAGVTGWVLNVERRFAIPH